MRFEELAERFNRSVEAKDKAQCWIWKGAKNNKGYGVFNLGANFGCKLALAHRMAFELAKGEIPRGQHILHSCDTPLCCNPSHLSIGTHPQNMREMAERKRSAIGRRNAFAKLTDEAVRSIRNDPRSVGTLAAVYGVAHQTISKARLGNTWRHVA